MAENEGSKTEEIALETIESTRKSLGILTKQFLDGSLPENKLRASVYAANALCKLLVAEKHGELEKRIAKLEAARAGK